MIYISQFTNTEDGIEGRVFYRQDGQIGTALYDLDADEMMLSTIYPAGRLDGAKAHAKVIAGL